MGTRHELSSTQPPATHMQNPSPQSMLGWQCLAKDYTSQTPLQPGVTM